MDELTQKVINENEIYEIYDFTCKVEDEKDKIYYWERWEKVYELIDPIIKTWGYKKITSNQSFTYLLKKHKDGTIRCTGKNAPTGGLRNWNYQSNKDISQKYLSDNKHLIYQFQNPGKTYFEFISDRKVGLINIYDIQIKASVSKKEFLPLDFYLLIDNCFACSIASPSDLHIQMIVKKGVLKTKVLNYLLSNLIGFSNAKEVYKNFRPYFVKVKSIESGVECIENISFDSFKLRDKNNSNKAGNIWIRVFPTLAQASPKT
jgi:hypothetical protein